MLILYRRQHKLDRMIAADEIGRWTWLGSSELHGKIS